MEITETAPSSNVGQHIHACSVCTHWQTHRHVHTPPKTAKKKRKNIDNRAPSEPTEFTKEALPSGVSIAYTLSMCPYQNDTTMYRSSGLTTMPYLLRGPTGSVRTCVPASRASGTTVSQILTSQIEIDTATFEHCASFTVYVMCTQPAAHRRTCI